MKRPRALRLAGRVLNPLIGKSLVLYFHKPGRRAGRDARSRRMPYVDGS